MTAMNTNGKKPKRKVQPKPELVGVTLYPGDRQAIEEIKERRGLLRDADAIRMAIRELQRHDSEAKQTA